MKHSQRQTMFSSDLYPTQLPLPTAPVSVEPQLSNENQSVVESAPCEGNICQVQVNKIIQ